MPTLKDRLKLIKNFNIPKKTEPGNKILDIPVNIGLILEEKDYEFIAPKSKKYQLFGELEKMYTPDELYAFAINLSKLCFQAYSPAYFYKHDENNYVVLDLELLECRVLYDKKTNQTHYYLTPKPVKKRKGKTK